MARVDVNGIKEEIQDILQKANNTNASPRDLSEGMVKSVKKVLKLNPDKIPINATYMPAITVFTDSKLIELQGIVKNQNTAKRKGTIDFKLMALVWNSNILDKGKIDEDPADEDIERLMENTEEILRNNDTLNGKILWGFPTSVQYQSFTTKEQGHLRTALMSYSATLFY